MPNRSGVQFAKANQQLTEQYALAPAIHLVVDNLIAHSCKIFVDRFGPEQGVALWKLRERARSQSSSRRG